jgi:hypothetical protein
MTQENTSAHKAKALGGKASGIALTGLTVLSALIATSMSADGMWRVARGSLEMGPFTACGVFLFLELAQVSEAIRARVNYRLTGSTGADGAGMWILGAVNAMLAALEAAQSGQYVAVMVRVAAPLIAVLLWHRGIVLDEQVSHRERLIRRVVRAAYAARDTRRVNRRGVMPRLRHNKRLARATMEAALAGAMAPADIANITYTLHMVRESDRWRTGETPVVVEALRSRKPAPLVVDSAQTAVEEELTESTSAKPNLASSQELADVLDKLFPHVVPNRATAVEALRTQFGRMSERRADQARGILRERRQPLAA